MSNKSKLNNILYLVPSDFSQLKEKGVTEMIMDRDENGYFSNVYTLHPFAKQTNVIYLSEHNTVYQYSLKKFSKFNLLGRAWAVCVLIFQLFILFPMKIRKKNITVIRSQDPFFMGALGVWYKMVFRVPLLVSIHSDYQLHGTNFYMFGNKLLTYFVRHMSYRLANAILPIRESLIKGKLVTKYSHKVKVFNHYIKVNEFDYKPDHQMRLKYNLPTNKILLCFVGRLSYENRVIDLIEVMSQIQSSSPNVHLVICGDGDQFKTLRDRVNQLNLNNSITFTGFLDRVETYKLRASCDIAVNLIGGLSLLESAAMKLPIVAYDIDWHRELIEQGYSGYLVKCGNIQSLCEHIMYLVNDSGLRNSFGEAVYEKIKAKYEYVSLMKQRKDVYDKVLYGRIKNTKLVSGRSNQESV